MNKGYTSDVIVDQCKKMDEAGMPYIGNFLGGLGGHNYGLSHARESARVINQLKPAMIYASELTLFPDTPLSAEVDAGTFEEATELERIQELQEFIRCLTTETIFRAEHVTIPVPIYGKVPQDNAKMIAKFKRTIDENGEENLRNYLSTAQKEFGKVGVHFDSLYAARFVDNWSPMFYLKDKAKNRRAEMNGEAETAEIAQRIVRREVGHTLPDQMMAITAHAAKMNYNRIRKTKLFTVNLKRCISCGLCARQCPLDAIEMQNNHPVWVKPTCTLCLGCFHRCPASAIDYDGCSLINGQYVNKNVKLDD